MSKFEEWWDKNHGRLFGEPTKENGNWIAEKNAAAHAWSEQSRNKDPICPWCKKEDGMAVYRATLKMRELDKLEYSFKRKCEKCEKEYRLQATKITVYETSIQVEDDSLLG